MVYAGSIISLPFIYVMVKNTDYTDYFMYTIGIVATFYFIYELNKIISRPAKQKLLAAFAFIFLYFLFNAIFEQSGGSLSLFAKDNVSSDLLFFTMDPNVVNNSSNSLFVIIFSPLVGLLG